MPDETKTTTVDVCLIRTDPDGEQLPLVDVLTVPASVADGVPHAAVDRVFDLLVKIANDFKNTPEGRAATNDGRDPVLPVHVLDAPPEFLARYGVSARPVDTELTLEIRVDETLVEGNYDD